jgi:hypothetical protein
MQQKIIKTILSGIVATIVMTLFTMVAPMMGMPEMDPPQLLSGMLGVPIFVGWILHFLIGIFFAYVYVQFFSLWLRKISLALKGAVYGFIVFVFAQVMMALMGAVMGNMPPPEGSMILMIIGSLVGHVVFGIVVALIAKE